MLRNVGHTARFSKWLIFDPRKATGGCQMQEQPPPLTRLALFALRRLTGESPHPSSKSAGKQNRTAPARTLTERFRWGAGILPAKPDLTCRFRYIYFVEVSSRNSLKRQDFSGFRSLRAADWHFFPPGKLESLGNALAISN